jgi:hypothetical protein
MLNKPGLPWGASKEGALFADAHWDMLTTLPSAERVDRIRVHFQGVWDRKANVGSLVHAVNDAWVWGAEAGPELADTILPPAKRNAEAAQSLWDETQPYIDGLAAFWNDVRPVWHECERGVVHDEPGLAFGGQMDGLVTIDGVLTRIDFKAGKLDKDTDRPFPENALQLTAYDYARWLATYDAEGNLSALEPNTHATRCCVVHIRPGGWDMFPVRCDDAVWALFCHLRRAWEWTQIANKCVGDPLPLRKQSLIDEGNAAIAALQGRP